MKQLTRFFSAFFLFSSCLPTAKVAESTTEQEFNDMAEQMSQGAVNDISVEELKQKTASSFFLLDTRQRQEYEVSHLANARWVGFDEFDLNTVNDLPKDATIVTYCAVGYRSERIGEKLQKAGFQNVVNLKGGIFDWVNKGNPIVDGKGNTVQQVHGYNQDWGKWVKHGKVVLQ